MDLAGKFVIIIFILFLIFILYATSVVAIFTIYDSANITQELTVGNLSVINCDVKASTNGTLYCGFDIGNTSAEIWAVIDNETYHKLSTTMKGTNITADSLTGTQIDESTLVVQSGWTNTSTQVWTVIENETYHKFSETITWGNLSSWNLNVAWINELGWKNLTDYPTACTGTQKVTGIGDTLTCAADVDTANTSAEIIAVVPANTSSQMHTAIDNKTYHKFIEEIIWANLTSYPTACTNKQYISAFGDTLTCTDAYYNTSEELQDLTGDMVTGNTETLITVTYQDADGTIDFVVIDMTNTSTEMISAINGSGTFNITSWKALTIDNTTERTLFETDVDTANSSAEIIAVINATSSAYYIINVNASFTILNTTERTLFEADTDTANTSQQIWDAIDNETYHKYFETITLGNVTDPTDCAAGLYVYGKSGSSWSCRADQPGNTSTQILAVAPGNTTAEIHAAIDNKTYHKYIDTLNYTNLTVCSNSQILKVSGGVWTCAEDAGAVGVNYWQVGTSWMFPNETAGGLTSINVTNLNATTIYENSVSLTAKYLELTDSFGGDVSGTYNALLVHNTSGLARTNISDFWTYNASYHAHMIANISAQSATIYNTTERTLFETDTANTSAEIWDTIDNKTYHRFFETITQTNISVIADWDIGSYELKAQTFESDVTTGTAPFTIASTTQVANLNVSTAGIAYDVVSGSSVIADTEVDDAITIAGAVWVNSTKGMNINNDTKMYFGSEDNFCIFYNSTLNALVSTNNC